jgi:hypothetical protein
VNDIPRPIIEADYTFNETGDTGIVGAVHILTPEETPLSFNIRGYDPEGDPFDMVLIHCYPEGGDLYLLNSTMIPQWLNCTYVNTASQPLTQGNVCDLFFQSLLYSFIFDLC